MSPDCLEAGTVLEPRIYGLVYDYLGAWNRHDADHLAALYADDALYEDLRLTVTLDGSAAIRGHLRQFFAACPDTALAVAVEPLAADDRAYVEWLMVGTGAGRTQQLRGVSVMLIEDGRIVRQTDYAQPAGPVVSRAIGDATAPLVATVEDNIAWGE